MILTLEYVTFMKVLMKAITFSCKAGNSLTFAQTSFTAFPYFLMIMTANNLASFSEKCIEIFISIQ